MTGLPASGTLIAVGVITVLLVCTWLYLPRRRYAARAVAPAAAAMALADDYLSGALIIGFAGLVLASGAGALWLGAGALAGVVVMLALVAAPVRRSGAYTLSDFTEWRLNSRKVRRVASACVCFAAWTYLLPQFQGAGLMLTAAAGVPPWTGVAVVIAVVVLVVASGRTHGKTVGQAMRFWVKLAAIAVPLVTVVALAGWARAPHAPTVARAAAGDGAHPLFGVYSLLAAMILGTMGLPFLVLRLYTVPSARGARRTLFGALCLLAPFLLLPTAYGVLGRGMAPGAAPSRWPDGAVFALPGRLLGGYPGAVATALLAAGVFCAFVSAATAMVLAVAATIAQCLLGGGVHSFRVGAVIAVAVPLVLMSLLGPVNAGVVVPYAFAIAAASLCPLLLLGTWWRRLTDAGAAAGMAVGGGATVLCLVAYLTGGVRTGWLADIVAHPALVTAPVGCAVMIGVSLLTPGRVPDGTDVAMARMHLPEALVGAATVRSDS